MIHVSGDEQKCSHRKTIAKRALSSNMKLRDEKLMQIRIDLSFISLHSGKLTAQSVLCGYLPWLTRLSEHLSFILEKR